MLPTRSLVAGLVGVMWASFVAPVHAQEGTPCAQLCEANLVIIVTGTGPQPPGLTIYTIPPTNGLGNDLCQTCTACSGRLAWDFVTTYGECISTLDGDDDPSTIPPPVWTPPSSTPTPPSNQYRLRSICDDDTPDEAHLVTGDCSQLPAHYLYGVEAQLYCLCNPQQH